MLITLASEIREEHGVKNENKTKQFVHLNKLTAFKNVYLQGVFDKVFFTGPGFIEMYSL